MKKAIVVVDMQKDFVDGVLGTKEAQAIVPDMIKYLEEKFASGEYDIYATRDTHQENYMETQEGKKLPVPHCIEGTDGWQIIPELAGFNFKQVFNKPTFGSTELMGVIQSGAYDEVTLIGVCTGICVISNAMLIKAALPECKVSVVSNLCACVTPLSHNTALDAMSLCQIELIW